MKQEEKLQKLIKLAHINGWTYNPYGEPFSEESYSQLVNLFCRGDKILNYEVVIFDHEFIDALCKAKYGEEHNYLINISFNSPSSSILTELALNEGTDRINYLYEVFIG